MRSSGAGPTARQVPAAGDPPLGAGVFASGAFPAAARPGDHVYLLPLEEQYRVESIRPIANIAAFSSDDGNDVSLSANAKSDKVEPKVIHQDDDHLAQLRALSLGEDLPVDVRAFIDQGGREAPNLTTKNHRAYWTRDMGLERSHDGSSLVTSDDIISVFSEIWQYEDRDIFFQFEETGGATPTVDGLYFAGWIYKLSSREVSTGSRRAIPVPVESLD